MRKFRGITISIMIGIVLIIGTVVFTRTVESKIEGFPVPMMAKYIHDNPERDHQYEWWYFEYGLPFFYERAIKSKGWEQTYREG
ncbi:hypothetical protein ACFDTO_30750 [Microbacteriaceae bacterium 4G12]